jgi:hypothetical protein
VRCADGVVCEPGGTCCVRSVAGSPSSCEGDCTQGSPHTCDGPEDCGGNACCGNLVSGVACSGTPECAAGVPQHCHLDSDCRAGERCLSVTVSGVPTDACTEN